MGRGSGREGLVCEGEVAPLVPAAPERDGARRSAPLPDLRGSRLLNGDALKRALVDRAQAEGFDTVRVTAPDRIGEAGERLALFLEAGRHGTMDWMERRSEERASPTTLWPQVRSIVMLGMNYGPTHDPLAELAERQAGIVAAYARGDDYHDVIKKRLKAVARWLFAASEAPLKVFVDTAPVMEKPLAAAAGLGWQGKHTNLVSREFGSWLLIGSIYTATCRQTRRSATIAARAGPASTSARQPPSLSPISSMRGAASPI
jgi:epoxyqueuosine reductase